MTIAELVSSAKRKIGPGFEQKYSDQGLRDAAQEAIDYMVDEIQKVNPDYFKKSFTTSTRPGVQEYDFDEPFSQVLKVEIKCTTDSLWTRVRPVNNIGIIPVSSRTDSNQGFSVAEPFYYVSGDNLGIMPIPTENGSANLRVWVSYTPQELDESEELPFPRKYHQLPLMFMRADYLTMDQEYAAADRLVDRFYQRVAQMVESLTLQVVDEPRSVEITGNTDLYLN